MVPFLLTPREHHNVQTVAEYRARHAAFLGERRQRGARYAVHEVDTPIAARIDAGTWLIDCDCGAGNATDPEWGLACCFGCGAVHTRVEFPTPDTRSAIEALLIARPRTIDRAWRPGEAIVDLVQENLAIRAGIPEAATRALQRGAQ
jgi:hypothetical protein